MLSSANFTWSILEYFVTFRTLQITHESNLGKEGPDYLPQAFLITKKALCTLAVNGKYIYLYLASTRSLTETTSKSAIVAPKA